MKSQISGQRKLVAYGNLLLSVASQENQCLFYSPDLAMNRIVVLVTADDTPHTKRPLTSHTQHCGFLLWLWHLSSTHRTGFDTDIGSLGDLRPQVFTRVQQNQSSTMMRISAESGCIKIAPIAEF